MAWQHLGSKQIYQNPWLTVREDDVIQPDGSESVYGVIERALAANIIALDDDERFPLVHCDRYPTSSTGWEIPSGTVDPTDLFAGAQRELLEEAGVQADHWEHIGHYWTAPSYSTGREEVFIATDLTKGEPTGQQEEGIDQVRWVSFHEWFEVVRTGGMTDGPSIASIMMAWTHLGNRRDV